MDDILTLIRQTLNDHTSLDLLRDGDTVTIVDRASDDIELVLAIETFRTR